MSIMLCLLMICGLCQLTNVFGGPNEERIENKKSGRLFRCAITSKIDHIDRELGFLGSTT